MSVGAAPFNSPLVDPSTGRITAPWLTWLSAVSAGISGALSTAAITASTTASTTTTAPSSVDASTLTGTTLAGNVIFSALTTLGTLSALNVNGPSTLTGIYIPPTAAVGGGAYADGFAIRWSTNPSLRTAIWRSDATGASPVKTWNFDNLQTFTDTAIAFTVHTTQTTSFSATRTVQAVARCDAGGTIGPYYQVSCLDSGAPSNTPLLYLASTDTIAQLATLGIGTAANIFAGVFAAPTLTCGFAITPGQIAVTGPMVSTSSYTESSRAAAMGYWTDVAFAAGNFTALGAMTWTVTSGEQVTYSYTLVGKTMTVAFNLQGTTVGGTPSSELFLAIPGGFSAAKAIANPVFLDDNGTRTTGVAVVAVGATVIVLVRTDAANFSASAANTTVEGEITFAVN